MVEHTVRSTAKQVNAQETEEKKTGVSAESSHKREAEESMTKMFSETFGAKPKNEECSRFEQVLNTPSVTEPLDLKAVYNVKVYKLDSNSPVKKYLTGNAGDRKEAIKSIAQDAMSSDGTRQAHGNEMIRQIAYFEALGNLSMTQGKTDEHSKTIRNFALHALVGQELSAKGEGDASDLISKVQSTGNKGLQEEIEKIRTNKENQRKTLANLAVKCADKVEKGDLGAAAQLVELHLQQVGEGNQTLSDVAQKSQEVLEAADGVKKATEKPVTLEDAKPTAPRQGRTPEGTLILPGENGEAYSKYDVKAGNVFNSQGKEIGKLQDDGTVLLRGMSPFKISANNGCAFHGKGSDGERLDLVSKADQKKFHGFIATADGKEVFTITGGNMYDAKGKMLGKFGDTGAIETSDAMGFSSQPLSKFSAGARVIGEENGKIRSFVASSTVTDGFMQIKDETTGAYVRHEVKMGMLIDSRTGDQTGWIVPPEESADGKLTGGFIITNDNGQPRATAFTDKQDMIFSLRQTGVSGWGASEMQGITTGKNEVFNIAEAKRIENESRRFFKDAQNKIAASESMFSIKTIIGLDAAQTAKLKTDEAKHQRNFDELNKLLDADRTAIAYVPSFKATSDAAKDALHGKSDNDKPVEAPPTIEIPSLASSEITATVNGKLAIGNEIFTIKNGDLYAAGKEDQPPSGKLLPGYVARLAEGDRTIDLSKEIHVAMRFTSSANAKPAELIGMGPGHMTDGHGYQQGGLIDAHSLTATARLFEAQARKGNEEYFANRPYITGSIGNWMLGDREGLLEKYANQVGDRVNDVDSLVQNLMRDAFDPEKASNVRFDAVNKELALLMHLTGAESKTTQELAKEGQNVQGEIKNTAGMVAITIATAGVGPLCAALVKGGQLAALGITGTRAVLALEITTGVVASAAIRTSFNASPNSRPLNDAASGAVEGLTLMAQAKLLAKMSELSKAADALKKTQPAVSQTLLKTTMSKANVAAKELGISTMTSAGLMAGDAIRKGENPISAEHGQALLVSTFTNLAGRYVSARAGEFMNSKYVQSASREMGKTSTLTNAVQAGADGGVNAASARVISSMQEQMRAPFGEITLAKTAADVLDAGAMGGATGLAMAGALKAGELTARGLAAQYGRVKNNIHNESPTTEISPERLHALKTQNADKAPGQARKLETLWKGLSDAVERANSPRPITPPPNKTIVREADLTAEQRKANELDFQRRVEAGEFTSRKAPVDNKPITDPVEISKKVIDKHIHALKHNHANAGAQADSRRTELIKPEVYFDDSIGPRQLFTVATPAKVAINDSLKLVAKIGHGAAEDIANQSISIGPKQFGHTREVKAQLTLAKETQGDIDPSNIFVKTGPNRAEAIIGHVRNVSQEMPETDYFATTKEIAGRRGMSRWMEQNEQRRAIQHEVSKDYNKRLQEASEDPGKELFLRRAPQEIAAATVAAKATQIKLESEISELTKAGQSTKQHQEALTKLQEFQKNLAKAREDAGYNPVFKAYFAELDAYMKKAFEN